MSKTEIQEKVNLKRKTNEHTVFWIGPLYSALHWMLSALSSGEAKAV